MMRCLAWLYWWGRQPPPGHESRSIAASLSASAVPATRRGAPRAAPDHLRQTQSRTEEWAAAGCLCTFTRRIGRPVGGRD